MATHSSVLAWRIPGMGAPGGLTSMGSHRVGYDWSDLAAAAADNILKSRDITLPTNVQQKGVVFPIVMYGCDNWTIKTAEHRRIDALELWCWRRLLKSPLDCKEIQRVHPKGDQSWLFIERSNVKGETPNALATWCKELTHWKRPWCWEKSKAVGEGDNRGWDSWMA